MIASYLHNFIFIKTKKTAGTTVEVALGEVCGPDDIVTPFGPHDELVRGNLCRNFASDPAIEEALKQAVTDGDRKAYLAARKQCEFFPHMKATEIRERLAPEFWDKACKVTVERHPYEKALSGAYFSHRPRRDPAFTDFLDKFLRGGSYASYSFYTIDGEVVVDEILRQESLHDDLRRVGERLGVSIPTELRRMKTRSRKDPRPARDILSDEQKQIVYAFCRKEFELLGYEP